MPATTSRHIRLYEALCATLDAKYIAGLDLTAKVKDIYVRLRSLPPYEAVCVGDNSVHVSIDPLVLQAGVGMEL